VRAGASAASRSGPEACKLWALQSRCYGVEAVNTTAPTIGRLARRAGVHVETIRYYQRVGLIAEPGRPREGFRRYAPETADRIVFIKRAQQLGFSLAEIRDLLDLGEGHCQDVRVRAEARRAQIAAQIRDLEAMRATLDELIAACRRGKRQPCCPIVQTLARQGES
jgi:MerR family transcriptional regulator, mercuric resistance operon regulatory protein